MRYRIPELQSKPSINTFVSTIFLCSTNAVRPKCGKLTCKELSARLLGLKLEQVIKTASLDRVALIALGHHLCKKLASVSR